MQTPNSGYLLSIMYAPCIRYLYFIGSLRVYVSYLRVYASYLYFLAFNFVLYKYQVFSWEISLFPIKVFCTITASFYILPLLKLTP